MEKRRSTVYNSLQMGQMRPSVSLYSLRSIGTNGGVIALLLTTSLSAIDNLHFYRANFWWGEPRFERPWLTTFDAGIAGGSTSKERDCTGQLVSLGGELSLNEATFDFRQNFTKGLFTQVYLPVRSFRFKHMRVAGFKTTGPGDLSVGVGVTTNYQKTTYLDFIDGTIKIAGLFPTGLKSDCCFPANLPTGYNGHWGISLDADSSIGLWEWLTLGANAGALWLFSSSTYAHIGCYLKGDHFNEIFSLALGYSYNTKVSDWTMHTLHVFAEFDFAKRGRKYHPRVNIVYNTPLAGKRILNMGMGGAGLGVDITWQLD